jgi:hypothetical protein
MQMSSNAMTLRLFSAVIYGLLISKNGTTPGIPLSFHSAL